MSKPLAQFYDLLLPDLPGVATPLVDSHLVQVARDFCLLTRAWRGDLDPIDSIALQASYDLSAPEVEAELVQLHKLTVNATLLWDEAYFDQDALTGDAPKYSGNPVPFSQSDDLLTLTLIDDEIPDAGQVGGITGRCSMVPQQDATVLPDLLWQVHSEAMRAGVLSRLMLMPGKPWSAGPQGLMHATEYSRKIQRAAANAGRGNTRAPLRTRVWG